MGGPCSVTAAGKGTVLGVSIAIGIGIGFVADADLLLVGWTGAD